MGKQQDRRLSEEEFKGWLTPSQALKRLDLQFGSGSGSYISKHTLLERLRAGVVRAVAELSVVGSSKGIPMEEMHPDFWVHVEEEQIFWTSGDLTYRAHVEDGFRREVANFRHLNVRFDPAGIEKIVEGATNASARTGDAPSDPNAAKGPPVSDALLKAWYALYLTVYQDTSEDHAWRSAQGMFPDKLVSRAKIRALRGQRAMGRPKKKL